MEQLEPQLPRKHVWVDYVEDDDVGVGLLARSSSHPTYGVGTAPASSSELEPVPASAPTNGASSEHFDQKKKKDKEEEATADDSRRNDEVGEENGEGDGVGNSVYFDKLQGTESINGISEMQSEIPNILSMEVNHLHEETNTSFKHFNNATNVDANVDLIGEIEEDLVELDVENVLAKQNTHDLYCPNCNSCITRKVILRRRKPQVSKIRRKPKPVKKSDPIPSSEADGRSGDTPEIYPIVSPTPAPDEQNSGSERDQEAFSCLSCFSLFIPIGNGCFKIFQFFRHGRQNEHTQSPQEIGQRENIQSPRGINLIENAQSPQEISQKEKTQSLEGMSQNENAETPAKVSHNEDTQSAQKRSRNEDRQSPQKISRNEDKQSPQDINQNESKQSPQKMPTAKTNWISSIFAFQKGKATVEKEPEDSKLQHLSVSDGLLFVQAGHASTVQNAAVPTASVTNEEYIDGAAIKPEEPGISNIFSSTNSSRLDNLKAESREKEADADMFQRNAGDNEIKDIEAGLLEPTLYPRTEVAPSSQTRTQNERRVAGAGEAHEWEILKSIVYGGLTESITSFGVVSSAAGAGADTLNVFALGLANLIGGLVVISHNLRELKKDQLRGASTVINNEEDRYQVLLGRRQNFALHVTVAIVSFLIFGLVPPVVYGFSFRKSDGKDLKLAAMAGASLVCIILLAFGKGHVRKPHRAYFRTVSYYVVLGITTSGISYLVGELIEKLLVQLGLFESSSAVSVPFLETTPLEVGRASY